MQGFIPHFPAVHGLDGVHGSLGGREIYKAHAAALGGALLMQHFDTQDGAVGSESADPTLGQTAIITLQHIPSHVRP